MTGTTVQVQDGVIRDLDPRSGELIAEIPVGSDDDVDLAVHEAREAFESWSRLSFRQRAEHLLRVRDLMLDRVDALVDTICRETGKLPAEAVATELLGACELIGFYAKKGERFLRPRSVSPGSLLHKRCEVRYEPRGVVGVISPWNYPFILSFTPVVTALFAGNTAVLKPSEKTPLVGMAIGELFDDVGGHRGIVRVVPGDGSTGAALASADVQMICFVGSVRTGRKVMQAAAERLTPVILELGGKDPMIVCADADLERAANAAVWGAFQNCGQACMSVERVYVEEAVYEPFVQKVLEKARGVRQGAGPGFDIGSMTFPPQIETVRRHVEDALARGAKVLLGGFPEESRRGLWYPPTVLVDVDHSMAIMREETFGPVLPIMKVRDLDEALRLANDSEYGLGASVFTRSSEVADNVVSEIESGNVCVNDCLVNYGIHALPYGGVKHSGFGRVHGEEGLRQFCVTKAVVKDRGWLRREPHWYPIPRWLHGAVTRVLRLQYRRGLRNKLKALLP
ncbi:MAG: aldehyde dehydrogenase [Acidimicrobiales bacterium]|nr:MAG: aldehyde dehydrogenase [Acidimicrobiales bacterium]